MSFFTRKPGRYFPADYRIEHLGYSCLLLIGSSCELLSNKQVVVPDEHGEYAVPDVFFIIMTIKHQLVMAAEVEQAIDKKSFICPQLLLRTNALISQMMDNPKIHQSDIHNYLLNFRNELPKLSLVFGGSGILLIEF